MPQVTTLLALAGPAEAAEFFGLIIGFAFLLLLCFLVTIAVVFKNERRGIVLAILAFALLCGSAVLIQPWRAFVPLSAQEAADPDVVSWLPMEQAYAIIWAFVATLVIAVLAFVCVGRRRPVAA